MLIMYWINNIFKSNTNSRFKFKARVRHDMLDMLFIGID